MFARFLINLSRLIPWSPEPTANREGHAVTTQIIRSSSPGIPWSPEPTANREGHAVTTQIIRYSSPLPCNEASMNWVRYGHHPPEKERKPRARVLSWWELYYMLSSPYRMPHSPGKDPILKEEKAQDRCWGRERVGLSGHRAVGFKSVCQTSVKYRTICAVHVTVSPSCEGETMLHYVAGQICGVMYISHAHKAGRPYPSVFIPGCESPTHIRQEELSFAAVQRKEVGWALNDDLNTYWMNAYTPEGHHFPISKQLPDISDWGKKMPDVDEKGKPIPGVDGDWICGMSTKSTGDDAWMGDWDKKLSLYGVGNQVRGTGRGHQARETKEST